MEDRFGLTLDRTWLRRFRRSLRAWFEQHARDLPWRRTADPYGVWISEIMLQQTTVATVRSYFERFLEQFPNVHALAAASEQDVLRCWQGLGYYSRARNIHQAAKQIVERGGDFPGTVEELLELPGIGRYTAGAIVSLAFDRPAPIVEANTLRLYSRLLAYRGDPRSSEGQRRLWQFAEAIQPRQSPGQFNLALMDLGAMVCTPTEPACERCPVRSCCRALAENVQDAIPAMPSRAPATQLTEAAFAVRRQGKYLLIQRAATERWAGLWDFPRVSLDDSVAIEPAGRRNGKPMLPPQSLRTILERALAKQHGLDADVTLWLTTFRHTVTRYRITLCCFEGTLRCRRAHSASNTARWVSPRDFTQYPLTSAARKLAGHLS